MDFTTLLLLAPAVLLALATAATAISKLTANTKDDELARWLVVLHDLLVKLVPSGATMAQKRAPTVELPPTVHSSKG